ncbi:MAG: serine/threonine-protein kinase [Bacteroidota bacterium]
MEYEVDEIIDERYEVTGLCSDSGGMGKVLLVQDLKTEFEDTLALKYCRENQEEFVKRFNREVRLLKKFSNNSKVINVLDSNTEHNPSYFVMDYYPEGDLTNFIDDLVDNPEEQERVFKAMIECISELHSKSIYHRDIKPQNFLVHDDSIVVSDFGLGMESHSSSRFTSSSALWGTQGYLPPEFQKGGFKYADERGDIYMLGKSFYVLLTKEHPAYLLDKGIHPALYHIIEKACDLDKSRRYQSLPELKQALELAYDVILERGGELGEVNQLITEIHDKLENEHKYNSDQVIEFIQKLGLVDQSDQSKICLEIKEPFFTIITHESLRPYIDNFLNIYNYMVESGNYSWAFAETIAKNMRQIFKNPDVNDKTRSKALEIAIDAAIMMNRFAAMDTCIEMITSVNNDELGVHVSAVLQHNKDSFINRIEPSQCKCESIRKALIALNK